MQRWLTIFQQDMIKLAEQTCRERVEMHRSEKPPPDQEKLGDQKHLSLFHALLDSNLPENEKRPRRMAHEGFEILLAGSDTTARTMGIAVYHLLANESIAARLREELLEVMPKPDDVVELRTLEALPWLVSWTFATNLSL